MRQGTAAPVSGLTPGRAARLGHIRRAFAILASSLRSTGTAAPAARVPVRLCGLTLALTAFLALGTSSALAAPTVKTDPVAVHAITTAKLSGEITADSGVAETYGFFQYSLAGTDHGESGEENWNAGPGFFGPIPESASQAVEDTLTGLNAASEYEVRLLALDPATVPSPEVRTFTTDPAPNAPVIELKAPAPSYLTAQIQGSVDPEGGNLNAPGEPVPIHWVIETSETGEPGTWAEASSGDIVGAEAEESNPIPVSADPGLSQGKLYHYRLRATYAGQQAATPDETFETLPVAKPTLTIADASLLTPTSAEASGTVELAVNDPAFNSSCVFEYATEADFSNATAVACEPETILASAAQPVAVAANLSGLTPTATYHLRLLATNSGGPAEAVAAHTFTTPAAPPAVVQTSAGALSETGATLNAQIDPGGAPTTYHFEYGPTTAYGTSVPVPDQALGSDTTAHAVSAPIAGLTPSTTYHFRAVATNTSAGNPLTLGPDRTFRTFAPAPAAEACPNEQLRSENNSTLLAACRAYEMITPPFKDGGTELVAQAISADGSRMQSETLSGFAGVESNYAGALYVSVRSGSGWATEAIVPPASRFPAYEAKGMNADLTESLWGLREATQPVATQDLYLRGVDGFLVEVGPALPPAAGPPAGNSGVFGFSAAHDVSASADLSHVLFALQAPYWPGDTTATASNGASLYEYLGTGNTEPILVGVSDGATVVNGNTLPAGQLISECETVLGAGGSSSDLYNAISRDGETVFFTAGPRTAGATCETPNSPPFRQVYARIGHGPGAQTAAISQPTHADCEACLAGETAQGLFQGASEDGSVAFFLTNQELLPENPGRNLYEYDFDASNQHEKITAVSHLASGAAAEVLGVARVSEDGSRVYFVAGGRLTEEPRGGLGGPCWAELDQAELVEEETGAKEGRCRPKQGQPNLYVFERDATHPAGKVSFLTTLAGEADAEDWGARDERPVQATPDGRFLAFQSAADLLVGEAGSARQVFEYDAQSEELIRASVAEPGYAAGQLSAEARGATIPQQGFVVKQLPTDASTRLALSKDGRVLAFSSTAGLTPAAQTAAENGLRSLYEYRSAAAGIGAGRVSLLTDGSSPFPGARLLGIGSSGRDLFFKSAEPYLSSDTDTQFDLYDARSAGGFPASLATPSCAGEGCQGTPLAAPPKAAPATPGFHGPGNEPQKPPCPKGKVRKHGKCVVRHERHKGKKHHHRAKKHQRKGTVHP